MNTGLADALHDADGATLAQPRDPALQPVPSPLEAWPEQAIDACAPEGGGWSCGGTVDVRTTGLWS
jgi:hypothetical protein